MDISTYETVIFFVTATNKLEMTYDADGNLLCIKIFTSSSVVPSETKDYIGNLNISTTLQTPYTTHKAGIKAYQLVDLDPNIRSKFTLVTQE